MEDKGTTRRRYLQVAGATGLALGAGCTGTFGGSGGGTLKILDFGYVHGEEQITAFEERHGATVEIQNAGSSARELSLLRSGRSDHDLLALGNYAVTPAIDDDLIRPIDLERVPSYAAVFDFLKKDYFERDGEVYGVPRSFGQTPLVYNADEVDTAPRSWQALWDERYDGVIGGRDDARLQFLYARAAYGIEPLNPTNADRVDFDRMRDTLAEHVGLAGGLWGSGGDSVSLLRNGQVTLQPAWNYVVRSLQSEGFPVERVYPDEGTKAWFIQFCVRNGAENPDLAHTFIEEWFTEMGYESLMQPSGIAVPSREVFESNDVPLSEYGLDEPDRFIYEEPKPQSLVEAYTEAWTEAKNRAG
jgi:spermidine/putrescine transport system substrate-binding protein